MIELIMQEPSIGVVEAPEMPGVRVLKIIDPDSKISISVPMDLMSATRIGRALAGNALVTNPGLPGRGGLRP